MQPPIAQLFFALSRSVEVKHIEDCMVNLFAISIVGVPDALGAIAPLPCCTEAAGPCRCDAKPGEEVIITGMLNCA